jgi:multidrug efflux pump subunit AcrB
LFLKDWGTALATGLVVPVTILVTFLVMKIMGQTFNMMTLGGLAAASGLVVDTAIVVVENIVLHRDGGEGPLEAVSSAIKELTVPLVGSTLTPIVVFLPLISITGVTGVFFRALAIVMSVSLLISLALALGWTTNLGTFLIKRKETSETNDAGQAHDGDNESAVISEEERLKRMMAAEEASLQGGWFGSIIGILSGWAAFACF